MNFDENDEIMWEFGIDFNIGDQVYADCDGTGIAGILVWIENDIAYVDFGGTYGIMSTSLKSVSPYDTT